MYGPEVDWWSVGCVMYDMKLGKYLYSKVLVHPERYSTCLTQDAVSILRMVSINCGTRNTLVSLMQRCSTLTDTDCIAIM